MGLKTKPEPRLPYMLVLYGRGTKSDLSAMALALFTKQTALGLDLINVYQTTNPAQMDMVRQLFDDELNRLRARKGQR